MALAIMTKNHIKVAMKTASKNTSLLLAFAPFFIATSAHSMLGNSIFSMPMPVFQTAKSAEAASERATRKPKKVKKAKGRKGGGVTFYEGSAENRSERDRRLTRECKGRPNSGACEGYARP